ncbi:MAG: Rrf2 family transcriptional regulator [Planctomycetota bacterium]
MPSLAQGTGYGVLALGFIAAAAGRPLLVRSIAESCELPAPFLSKIVNRMARAGLVRTQRGINGGVTLARDAVSITLYDVCVALDDPILERKCVFGIAECSDQRACPAHAFNMAERQRFADFLQGTTIADVAAFESKRRWQHTGQPLA